MSNVKFKRNRRALHKCLDIFRCVSDAQFALLMAKKDDEAKKLDQKLDELEKEINRLRRKILDDWLAKIPALLVELGRMKTEAQDAVDDIKDDVETAQKVVDLIGKVDDVIKFIGPLLA